MNENLLDKYKKALNIASQDKKYNSMKDEIVDRAKRIAAGEARKSDIEFIDAFLKIIEADKNDMGEVILTIKEFENGMSISGSMNGDQLLATLSEIICLLMKIKVPEKDLLDAILLGIDKGVEAIKKA